MRVRPPHPELLRFLAAYDKPVIELALATRKFVLQEVPDAGEVISDAYSAVAISFTFTGRWQDGFCHIAAHSRHVNLGFDHGAHLPDPHHALEGKGTQVRHIPIKSLADLERPYLRDYIQSALLNAGRQTRSGPEIVINEQKGAKRRPGK
jgi:hypothetical protein